MPETTLKFLAQLRQDILVDYKQLPTLKEEAVTFILNKEAEFAATAQECAEHRLIKSKLPSLLHSSEAELQAVSIYLLFLNQDLTSLTTLYEQYPSKLPATAQYAYDSLPKELLKLIIQKLFKLNTPLQDIARLIIQHNLPFFNEAYWSVWQDLKEKPAVVPLSHLSWLALYQKEHCIETLPQQYHQAYFKQNYQRCGYILELLIFLNQHQSIFDELKAMGSALPKELLIVLAKFDSNEPQPYWETWLRSQTDEQQLLTILQALKYYGYHHPINCYADLLSHPNTLMTQEAHQRLLELFFINKDEVDTQNPREFWKMAKPNLTINLAQRYTHESKPFSLNNYLATELWSANRINLATIIKDLAVYTRIHLPFAPQALLGRQLQQLKAIVWVTDKNEYFYNKTL